MLVHQRPPATIKPVFLPLLICLIHCLVESSAEQGKRIAIIGGGIGGSFTAKYLAEYDVNHRNNKRNDCSIDEIVVFDVSPPYEPLDDGANPQSGDGDVKKVASSSDPRPPNHQGSRVSSVTLRDGSTIELGASIIYSGNRLVVNMMEGDSDYLVKGKPMGMGKKKNLDEASSNDEQKSRKPEGFGIYHGNQEWLLQPALFSSYPSILRKIMVPLYFIWRYNFDYFRLQRAVKQTIHAFNIVYALLNDTQKEVTYFNDPMEMWDAMGLKSLAGVSFHEFLDELGLSRDKSLELNNPNGDEESGWNWRRWLPGMGCLRSELLTGVTINTYNQDLNELNGLVGLVAYVPAGGDLFSVEGGNYKLMNSAIRQAQKLYDGSDCKTDSSSSRVKRRQKTVTSVVSSENSMELFSEDESLGEFDVVILAAPLQMCRIKFLMHSPMGLDPSILHEMPLTGVHENIDAEDVGGSAKSASNEHGGASFAKPLLPSATTPYTSVVTTIISNVTLNSTHFGIKDDQWPRSIFVSERGKSLEGITTLTILSAEKRLVKTFSTESINEETLLRLFGPNHIVEYVQKWGGGNSEEYGRYGGATPSFRGGLNSEPLPYLLYDGAAHYGKITGPALYYVNAVESAVAAIEISAIGAKSVAKLVARRMGLIAPTSTNLSHDEL